MDGWMDVQQSINVDECFQIYLKNVFAGFFSFELILTKLGGKVRHGPGKN